jgi:uncharacterized membrane protein YphA (DoxX/SURF4 family)
MKAFVVVTRLLLGLPFLLIGLNDVFGFMELPVQVLGELPGEAESFMQALERSRYLLPVLFSTEIVCGALLVLGIFVPLALVMLAPILVNIAGFHLELQPDGLPVAIVLWGLWLFLVWAYGRYFGGLLTTRRLPLD